MGLTNGMAWKILADREALDLIKGLFTLVW
jgi:hypothetical protein